MHHPYPLQHNTGPRGQCKRCKRCKRWMNVPDAIKELKTSDINELSESVAELMGILEASEKGQQLFQKQKDHASRNLHHAHGLQAAIADIKQLRQTLQNAQNNVNSQYAEWQTTEAEMLAAIAPFSQLGVAGRMRQAIREQESISKGLAESFLESHTVAANTDISIFLRNYKKHRQQTRLLQYKLEKLEKM